MVSAKPRSAKGSLATTVMPRPRAFSASRRPMLPRPTIPSVLPPSSRPTPRSQRPPVTAAWPAGMARASANIRPTASSATASALAPGAFRTGTPRAVQASRSMLSIPTPCFSTPLSRGAAARCAAVTGRRPTTRKSAARSRGVEPRRARGRAPPPSRGGEPVGDATVPPEARRGREDEGQAPASAISPCFTRSAAIALSCSGSGSNAGWRLAPTEASIRKSDRFTSAGG